jgi:hypothetical protein
MNIRIEKPAGVAEDRDSLVRDGRLRRMRHMRLHMRFRYLWRCLEMMSGQNKHVLIAETVGSQ